MVSRVLRSKGIKGSSDEFLFQSQLFMKYIYIFFEKCKQTFFYYIFSWWNLMMIIWHKVFFCLFFSSYMYIKIKKCNNFIKTNIEIETFFNFTKKKFGKQFFSCFFFLCLFMFLLMVRWIWIFLFNIGSGWGINIDFMSTRVWHNTQIFSAQSQRRGCGITSQQTQISLIKSTGASSGAYWSQEIAITIHTTASTWTSNVASVISKW